MSSITNIIDTRSKQNVATFFNTKFFLYFQVRCLEDYGELELEDEDVVVLKKNTIHFLPVSHCQHLIRQGILQHVA